MINYQKLTDIELIQNVRERQCSDSFEELVNRYDKVYYQAVQKFHRRYPESSKDDLINDVYHIFNQCINNYKTDKGTKFSTWLSHMGRFHCLNSNKNSGLTKAYTAEDIERFNQSLNRFQNFESNVNDLNNHVFSILDEMEDKRVSEIYRLRYIEGGEGNKVKSWEEVSKKIGLSVSGAILIHQKGKKYLYNRLQGQKEYNE